jgi:hypothetical protein
MHNQQFTWGGAWSFSCKILYLDKFFLPMTIPKSNPSKHYKHFRKAVAFPFQKLSDNDSGFRFWHICHVDRHGHFTLKQLRLPVLNETHTNSYTGPRLTKILKFSRVVTRNENEGIYFMLGLGSG